MIKIHPSFAGNMKAYKYVAGKEAGLSLFGRACFAVKKGVLPVDKSPPQKYPDAKSSKDQVFQKYGQGGGKNQPAFSKTQDGGGKTQVGGGGKSTVQVKDACKDS